MYIGDEYAGKKFLIFSQDFFPPWIKIGISERIQISQTQD